jgi:hypothetical protein
MTPKNVMPWAYQFPLARKRDKSRINVDAGKQGPVHPKNFRVASRDDTFPGHVEPNGSSWPILFGSGHRFKITRIDGGLR